MKRRPWTCWLALVLALALLGGCTQYYEAVARTNEAWAKNPRIAKWKFTPADPSKPAVLSNVTIEGEIPLDSWQRPIDPESPGKQAKQIAEGLTPLGTAAVVADGVKAVVSQGGTRTTTVNQSSTGAQSPNSAPGGNMGGNTAGTDSHAVDNSNQGNGGGQ